MLLHSSAAIPGLPTRFPRLTLNADDWQHRTSTFTYGSRDTKGELDEIIARSRELW